MKNQRRRVQLTKRGETIIKLDESTHKALIEILIEPLHVHHPRQLMSLRGSVPASSGNELGGSILRLSDKRHGWMSNVCLQSIFGFWRKGGNANHHRSAIAIAVESCWPSPPTRARAESRCGC
jgi:hypothetical protein